MKNIKVNEELHLKLMSMKLHMKEKSVGSLIDKMRLRWNER